MPDEVREPLRQRENDGGSEPIAKLEVDGDTVTRTYHDPGTQLVDPEDDASTAALADLPMAETQPPRVEEVDPTGDVYRNRPNIVLPPEAIHPSER